MYDERMEQIPYDEPMDIVAITVETFTARRAYEISQQYRSRGVKTTMGGMHAMLIPEEGRKKYIREAVLKNRFDQVFPMLKIISCWADGSASDYISKLQELFPTVQIQAKGLLATECFVSFPLMGENGSRLSIYSHFFEFRRLSDGKIVMANDLTLGEYEVIVTTAGGFYRYCISDIIEVLEVFQNYPPRIRFLRRDGITFDLFGEKLTEEFVRNICKKLSILEKFCLVAPEKNYYCLYTTADGVTEDKFDNALRENYHYNYCRKLGQLQKAKVIVVTGEPQKVYIQKLVAEGMRIGDIKPAYLTKKRMGTLVSNEKG